MRAIRQLAGVVLLVVLIGYPAMACLIPGAEMTAAERDCCKHMAHQCGSMNMSSLHPCCQKEISRPSSMLRASFVQVTVPAVSGMVVAALPYPDVWVAGVSSSVLHPPSESPPGASSILRI